MDWLTERYYKLWVLLYKSWGIFSVWMVDVSQTYLSAADRLSGINGNVVLGWMSSTLMSWKLGSHGEMYKGRLDEVHCKFIGPPSPAICGQYCSPLVYWIHCYPLEKCSLGRDHCYTNSKVMHGHYKIIETRYREFSPNVQKHWAINS